MEEFFNDMDRDFDKRLSFEEFLGEESHIEKVFKSMDKNGDGFVTKEEFHSVCKNLTEDQVLMIFELRCNSKTLLGRPCFLPVRYKW